MVSSRGRVDSRRLGVAVTMVRSSVSAGGSGPVSDLAPCGLLPGPPIRLTPRAWAATACVKAAGLGVIYDLGAVDPAALCVEAGRTNGLDFWIPVNAVRLPSILTRIDM